MPLATEVAETARAKAREGAPDHEILTTEQAGTYPCRHCLHWSQPGEQVVLFPYASIPAGRPYSEVGPIFVHLQSCPRYESTERYPADFRNGRVIRAYNRKQDMIVAEAVVDGKPETVIEKLFDNPETEFLQARSADRGCYTFRIERA
jgi:hypothetical protein